MHEGELAVTEATAARLIAQRFPALASSPVRRVRTAGTVNTIIRVGDRLAARFPLIPEAETALVTEAAAMRGLADACPVPTPVSFGVGAATRE